MTSKKSAGRPTPPRRLVEGTYKAFQLIEKGQSAQALEVLLELDQAYPNDPGVLGNLINAYYDLHDILNYEYAVRRLVKLDKRVPDLSYGLAGAYLLNGRPALAIQAFREALQRWPDHAKAADSQKQIPILEDALRQQAVELKLDQAKAFDLFLQHDQLRYCLDHGEFRQGRQVAQKLLQSYPTFVPALNNLSQIQSIEGDFDPAIATIQRALQIEPDNIHALSNLARLYFLRGRLPEAHQIARRLQLSQAYAIDRWTKTAEALTFLEDDQGVLDLYQRASAAGELEPPHVDAFFYHLLAVASFRLGQEIAAQDYWKKALKIDPHFAWSLENVQDLRKPVDERSGVWAFAIENWLLSPAVDDLSLQLEKMKHTAKKSDVQGLLARYLEEKHSEILFLAPHLLQRGDARACEFVVRTAVVSGHPALLAVAKDYVFGKRGSFQERFQAANILSEAELLPSGPIQMWSAGELRQVLLLNIAINPNPIGGNLRGPALKLAEQAIMAINSGDGQAAQAALEQALALQPDDPTLLNNLATALDLQGQVEQSRQMILQLHNRFPDYFFGIIGVAALAVEDNDLERAHLLLNGLMQRKEMHTTEFIALCQAEIRIWLADKKPDAARTWLQMWEKVDPQDPNIKNYRRLINAAGSRK